MYLQCTCNVLHTVVPEQRVTRLSLLQFNRIVKVIGRRDVDCVPHMSEISNIYNTIIKYKPFRCGNTVHTVEFGLASFFPFVLQK